MDIDVELINMSDKEPAPKAAPEPREPLPMVLDLSQHEPEDIDIPETTPETDDVTDDTSTEVNEKGEESTDEKLPFEKDDEKLPFEKEAESLDDKPIPKKRFDQVNERAKKLAEEVTQLNNQMAEMQGFVDLNKVDQNQFATAGEYHKFIALCEVHNNELKAMQKSATEMRKVQDAIDQERLTIVGDSLSQKIEAFKATQPRIEKCVDYVNEHATKIPDEVKTELVTSPHAAELLWKIGGSDEILRKLQTLPPARGLVYLGQLEASLDTETRTAAKPLKTVRSSGGSSIPSGAAYDRLRDAGYSPRAIARGDYRRKS